MIVCAQLSPVILDGLRKKRKWSVLFLEFCSVRHCTSKDAEWNRGKRERENVCVCVYFQPKRRLHPGGNSSNLLLSHSNNETWFDELTWHGVWEIVSKIPETIFVTFFKGWGTEMCSDTLEEGYKDHGPIMEWGPGMIHDYITTRRPACWVRTHVYSRNSCLMGYSNANVLGPSCKEAVSWDGNDGKWNNKQTDPTILAGW